MAGTDEMTAAQRAMPMPEILSIILKNQDEDNICYFSSYLDSERENFLFRCGLINKLWYTEAMPLLWSATIVGDLLSNSLPKYFTNIDSERRQFYANLVEKAVIVTVNEEKAAEDDAVLKGLKFPKLDYMWMMLDDHQDGFYVPRVEGHCIKTLEIDPRFELYPDTYGMTRDEIGMILEQIPVCPVP
jgi:hypothetical protein